MKPQRFLQLSTNALMLSLLAACGDSTSPPTASTTSISNFLLAYNQGLVSPQAMNTPAFLDLIDDAFLDSGYTKPQLADNLKQDSDSLAVAGTTLPADSVFPLISAQDALLSDCNDVSGICQLTATYVNAAPDSSKVSVAVPVRYKDGKFRLYGDQKSV